VQSVDEAAVLNPAGTPRTAIEITVRYFASARAAAGVESETVALVQGSTITSLTSVLADSRPPLGEVLKRCSFLIDELAVRDRSRVVPDGSTVDVLPPFAGG
jgi:sulfur-carrier protein